MTGSCEFLVFSGGNDRAVVAFLRALAMCGKRAFIIARTPRDRILRTKFRRDVVWIRETNELSLEIFVTCVARARIAAGQRTLVVLPSSEYFNHFLFQHRATIEGLGCQIPLVDEAVYSRLTNKREAASFFATAGISVPAEISGTSPLAPPLVAKPLKNVSSRGASLYPALLLTKDDVHRFQQSNDCDDFFLQEYVEGDSIYLLTYLSTATQTELVWSQRNLLQQPDGKSMLLAEPSAFHESSLASQIVQLLRTSGFTGLGMIELIQSDDRTVFIEMNPRPWGPIQFCTDQGQPLLQAFIGDCLHGDPDRYIGINVGRRRPRYAWMGGLLETLASRRLPVWHGARLSWTRVLIDGLQNDVYLRKDSWRCFLHELGQSAVKALHDQPHKD
jgi:hypothetical protein